GIPYAAPPVGPLRWQAPRLAPRWADVRPATEYGGRCAQLASGNGPEADGEDCLYLNVYTPVDHNEGSLPVLLMIHGGGLVNGAGDQHDGSMIAGASHIVVVSINYRLGPLGFLTVPGLNGSALTRAGNFGFLDQQAALRWVHRNIAAFGGDPARVTVDGESAGGFSVCALLTSPLAAGLFRAAIIQSGGCASQPPALAERSGLAFARQAGCPEPSTAARCLRGLPARKLLRAASGYLTAFTSGGPDLPVPVAQAIDDGSYTRVPVLIGANHDEGRGFSQAFANYTGQQYRILVAALYGSRAPGVLARYPLSAYPKRYAAAYAIGDIFTDSGFLLGIGGCPTQNLVSRLAATTRTWFYQFDDVHAPGLNRDLPGYQWGAAHAMELAYLWPGFGNGYSLYDLLTAAQRELSRQMVRYWGAFTTLGTPDVPGQPYWPGYLSGRIMSLRPGGHTQLIGSATYSAEHMCSFWNR
ncbi:MAG TPA: carboxylesterase family protein, partial [Streptosporangiaceae bacterium]|nr:carboxylesterase family protein [Streptosporangiaceae bacterium]